MCQAPLLGQDLVENRKDPPNKLPDFLALIVGVERRARALVDLPAETTDPLVDHVNALGSLIEIAAALLHRVPQPLRLRGMLSVACSPLEPALFADRIVTCEELDCRSHDLPGLARGTYVGPAPRVVDIGHYLFQ